MNYNVLYMNHEFYPGQYEYNWLHSKAVRCADETSQFKSISKDIAADKNMTATFMAKPKGAEGGSGCHFHISLNDLETGKNIFFDDEKEERISDTMRYFIGGLCKHAMALTALIAPTINCYKRFQPDSFAPVYVGWGYDNRTSYIRIPEDRGQATRVEVRAGSAACNPYLALGGFLAAGLDGILNKIEPPEVITTDLYHDTSRQNESLPRSLYKALELLKSDEWLTECLSPELLELFCQLKFHEVDEFSKFVTDWEAKTYTYHL